MDRRSFLLGAGAGGLGASGLMLMFRAPLYSRPVSAGVVAPVTSFYAYDFTTQPWAGSATWPNALYHAATDKTYVAWETTFGVRSIWVAAYNHTTEAWEGPYFVDTCLTWNDSHSNPALEILSDGRLAVFYGVHNGGMRWALSTQTGGAPNINSWARQATISGSYTYPKPVNIDSGGGAGTLYLLMRRTDTVGSDLPAVIRSAAYTSGGAVTFGADKEIIELTGRCYVAEVRKTQTGNNIEFMAWHATGLDTTREHVYYFRYITATGAIENLSAGVSTASGSQPITKATADASYREFTSSSTQVGAVSWCRDSNGYLHMLYGRWTSGNSMPLDHDWHNGTGWQGATNLATIPSATPGTGSFRNNWSMVPVGASADAIYPFNNNGGFTTRGGDDIARRRWSGSWGAQSILVAGDEVTALGEPTSVRNAHADLRVMFTETAQTQDNADTALMKRFFHGDSGFIDFAEPSNSGENSDVLTLNFQGADGATSTTDQGAIANRHTITFVGNAQLDTGVAPPYGTSWLLLDGTGDHLTVAAQRNDYDSFSEWAIEPGDTLEVVLRPNELGRTQYLVTTRDNPTKGWALVLTSANKAQFVTWNDSGVAVVNLLGTSTVALGSSYTFGVKRHASGGWSLYFNGTEEATAADSDHSKGKSALEIGERAGFAGTGFNGWIKQIRKTNARDRDLTVVPSANFPTY